MRVLGIDPGTRTTGYGIIEAGPGGVIKLVCEGQITPAGSMEQRLLAISDLLSEVTAEFKPDHASVESVFYSKNVRSAIMLGHARGVALLAAARAGIPVSEYAPTKIKQAVTGYGSATKAQVQKMVKVLLNTKRSFGADAADALAAAICHLNNTTAAERVKKSTGK